MDIGTAKPSADVRAAVPHHLIDIVEPSEEFSVAEFVRRAEAAAEKQSPYPIDKVADAVLDFYYGREAATA